MDKWTRDTAVALRNMSSHEAADWLIEKHPRDGESPGLAINLLAHLSLRKCDNLRLARYYLEGDTWAHDWPYRVFAKCLGPRRFTDTLEKVMADTERNRRLLHYHLCGMRPIFKSASDLAPIQEMIERLSGR